MNHILKNFPTRCPECGVPMRPETSHAVGETGLRIERMICPDCGTKIRCGATYTREVHWTLPVDSRPKIVRVIEGVEAEQRKL